MSHPAARLLSWLIAVVALQYLEWPALGCLAIAVFLAGGGVRRRWWILLRRARFLFLTLWLILAYGTPGDAWRDLPWAPTDAGIRDASLHALRLAVMLGTLAWLFESLPRERLMAGLWALARPFGRFGIHADTLVVRLALVFDYLEKAPPKGSWRRLLDDSLADDAGGFDSIRIDLPAWQAIDAGGVLGVALIFGLGAWLA